MAAIRACVAAGSGRYELADDSWLLPATNLLEEEDAVSQAATEVRPATSSRDNRPAVRLVALRKTYGRVVAAAGVDLEIAEGEFFTLLGPSGSGKTTLLRLIAGFERPDSGTIELGGENVTRQPPYAAGRQHRFSGLCALPPSDRHRQRRVRAQNPQSGKARAPSAG